MNIIAILLYYSACVRVPTMIDRLNGADSVAEGTTLLLPGKGAAQRVLYVSLRLTKY
jgi:hypothetical protein